MTTLRDNEHVNLMTEDQLIDWAAEFIGGIDNTALAFALDILGFKIVPNLPDYDSNWMVHFWPYARPMPDWCENIESLGVKKDTAKIVQLRNARGDIPS
jgi:hypothetical protein